MKIDEAIHQAINGRAVLFTGAGFSYGATTIHDKALPSGQALASELLTKIGYANNLLSLDKASSAFLRKKAPTDLINFLIERFTIKEVTASHRKLASLPWKRMYTTNYDLVFEEAAKLESMVCNSIDAADRPKDHLFKRNLAIHLNGAINRLSEKNLNSSFKLINESYAAMSFEDSGWAFHFRNDIRTAGAIIFIGYSMYDLDIRRILFDEDISDKCIFITGPATEENELELDDLSTLGTVAPIGVDGFASIVAKELSNYRPIEQPLLLESWSEVSVIESVQSHPTDEEVIDFLTEGRISNSLLMESQGSSRSKYLLDHIVAEKLKRLITTAMTPVVLTGELGTGKSFLIDIVSRHLTASGWRVFSLLVTDKQEISEAEKIASESGNKVFIIENYQRHIELLRWLADTKPGNVKIILSARTSIHELFTDDLVEIFANEFEELDLSTLRHKEIRNVSEIFDRFGLWGDRIGWNASRKEQFIRDECGSSLPSVLVHILKSRHITEKYKTLLVNLPNKTDAEAVLICAFSLEVAGYAPKVFHIQELLGSQVNWSKLKAQSELKSIIDINSHTVDARSSVLALHLLHSVFTPKRIIEVLIKMSIAAEARKGTKEYSDILNSLMRYKSISSILPDEQRLASTVSYYESVKNLSSTARNPQFWLQYAIACVALGQLERAERYFDDAYDFVYEGYNTFMLDNAYSRLLLDKCMLVSKPIDTILYLDEARDILFKQMRSEKRYYPYRVALGFFKIYERFLESWTPKQHDYFKFIFAEIRRNANRLDKRLQDQKYVHECLEQVAHFLPT